MRILIVSVNRIRQPLAVIPFGACLVAQAARRAGHDVRFLDLMFSKHPAQDLAAEVRGWQPEVVGLSIRNIDTNDARNPVVLADEAALFTQTVLQNCNATVVLGGAALGVMPRQLLQRTGAHLAVQADGDVIFPQLLDAMSRGEDPASIAGVLCPDSPPTWRYAPRDCPLTDCTVEDFSQWIDLRAYLSLMTAVPVQAKRGCPFECVYCTYNLAEGREYRLHPPQRVAAAIAALSARGVRDVEFVDSVFNSPYEHALAICQHLAAARLPVRLHTLDMNPRFIDDALLKTMTWAGFAGIGVTVDSYADEVLQGLRKGYGSAQVEQAAQAVSRHAIPAMWIFLLGGPGETHDTVRRTLDFAASRIAPRDVVFFQSGVRIYPGTPMERIAREQGLLQATADHMLTPVFYFSPQVSQEWLRSQLQAAARDHLNFITENSVGLPILQGLMGLSYRLGFRPPLWRHTRAIRRLLGWVGVSTAGQ